MKYLLTVLALVFSTQLFAQELTVPNMDTSNNVTLVVTTTPAMSYKFSLDGDEVFDTGKVSYTKVTVMVKPGKHEMFGAVHLSLWNQRPTNRVSVDVEFQPNTTYNISCTHHMTVFAAETDCALVK